VTKKPHPDNFGWNIVSGEHHAEKAVAIGNNGPQTIHLYGTDEKDLLAKIEAFEAEHASEDDDG